MSVQPPQLRQINRAVGAFVIIAAAIGVLFVLQAASLQRWLRPGARISIMLPRDGSFGLKEGGEVRMLGTGVGRITRVSIDDTGRMIAVAEVRDEFARFIRPDSQAIIRKTFGVAGDSFLDISRGSAPPTDLALLTLDAKPDAAPTDAIQQVVTELQTRIVPAIEEVRAAVRTWTQVGEGLSDPQGEFRQTLHNVQAITRGLEEGRGLAGRLLTDETIATGIINLLSDLDAALMRMGPIVDNLALVTADASQITGVIRQEVTELPGLVADSRATIKSLRQVLSDLERVSSDLPEIARDTRDAAATLPAVMLQARATLEEAEALLARLQSHWLLGGSDPGPRQQPLSPIEVLP